MKRFFAVSGLILAGVFVLGLISFAPMGASWGHGPGGGDGRAQGMGPGYGRGPARFDSSAIQTITGKVATLKTLSLFGHYGAKVVVIENDDKKVAVVLGPDFYLEGKKLNLKKGEEVSVVAFPVGYRWVNLFVAKSITAKGKTLALRDDAGLPLWRGQARSAGSSDCPGCGMGHGMMGRGMMGGGMGPARMLPTSQ